MAGTPFPAPVKIATLTDRGGASQPITTAPRVETAANGRYRWVLVGSGYLIPISRSNLVAVTDLTLGVPAPAGSQMGWFVDLAAGERVVTQPIANEGLFAWVGTIPTTDPCAPGLTSRTYAVRYDTGQSVLTNAAGVTVAASPVTTTAGIVRLQFIRIDGRIRLMGSDSATQIANLPGRFSGSGLAAARVNWREILE